MNLSVNREKPIQKLNWWLVYGPPRCGTTYMVKLIENCSQKMVSDWGLGQLLIGLNSVPNYNYIKFDQEKAFVDVSNNILKNAWTGKGNQLNLVFKQAGLTSAEYQILKKLWGTPKRIIFCLRDPSTYMASAQKKFPFSSKEKLQKGYCDSIKSYEKIGGYIFEYKPSLNLEDYVKFLSPLKLPNKEFLQNFVYKGEQNKEDTNQEMWSLYFQLIDYLAQNTSSENVTSTTVAQIKCNVVKDKTKFEILERARKLRQNYQYKEALNEYRKVFCLNPKFFHFNQK
jgi:hypothetical protein